MMPHGSSFIVNGATPAKNSALPSAGAGLRFASPTASRYSPNSIASFAAHSSTYAVPAQSITRDNGRSRRPDGFTGPSWRKKRCGGQPRMGPPEARLLD
jgi:hypothetical protein